MKRKCAFCSKEFNLTKKYPQQEYCNEICWKKAHNIKQRDIKHYLGGHKHIKRKKK